MFSFVGGVVIGIAVGVVGMAFAPSVGRAIKALFVSKTQAAKSAVQAGAISVESSVVDATKKL